MILLAALALAARADLVLTPTADAYVSNYITTTGSDQKTINYGAATTLFINNSGGIRLFFLRFDLRAVPQPITALTLLLTMETGAAGSTYNVFGLTNESWSESTITWNNAPAVQKTHTAPQGTQSEYLKTSDLRNTGQVLATFTSPSAVGGLASVHVTSGPMLDFINADTDKIVTFVIAEADPLNGPRESYYSRESVIGKPALVVSADPPPQRVLVVLQGGQSNADGRAPTSGLPTAPVNLQLPQDDVLYYHWGFSPITLLRPNGTDFASDPTYRFFGPEVTMGRSLADRMAAQDSWTQLAILKHAKGATSLSVDWKAGGTAATTGDGQVYEDFQAGVATGLSALAAIYPGVPIEIRAMAWVQGEKDIELGAEDASAYGSNLTAFISDVRQTYGSTLPFFYSRISDNQTNYSNPGGTPNPHYLTVRAQQESVGSSFPGAYMLDIDPPQFSVIPTNVIHFDAAGEQALGSAFAARIWDVIHLRITETGFVSGGGFRIKWNAIPGRSYTVRTSTTLTDWSEVNVGAVSEWTDTSAAGEPRKFYAVREN